MITARLSAWSDLSSTGAYDQGQALVAALDVRHDGADHYLSYLATAPEARGQGAASQLLRRCLDQYPGCWSLEVFSDNAAARRFYRNLLFLEEGERWWLAVRRDLSGAEREVDVATLKRVRADLDRQGFSAFEAERDSTESVRGSRVFAQSAGVVRLPGPEWLGQASVERVPAALKPGGWTFHWISSEPTTSLSNEDRPSMHFA